MYVRLTTKLLLQDNIYHNTAFLWRKKKKHVEKRRLYPIKYDLEDGIVDESINSNKLHSVQTYSKTLIVVEN